MLQEPTLDRREVTALDRDFLLDLYRSTRTDILATGLMPSAEAELIKHQFAAQDMDYRQRFPDAEYSVIETAGTPIGRMYVHRGDVIKLLEIALIPECQGQGIGTSLMNELLAEARETQKRIRLYVEHYNPRAKKFYQQLGFVEVCDIQTHSEMEWEVGHDSS